MWCQNLVQILIQQLEYCLQSWNFLYSNTTVLSISSFLLSYCWLNPFLPFLQAMLKSTSGCHFGKPEKYCVQLEKFTSDIRGRTVWCIIFQQDLLKTVIQIFLRDKVAGTSGKLNSINTGSEHWPLIHIKLLPYQSAFLKAKKSSSLGGEKNLKKKKIAFTEVK